MLKGLRKRLAIIFTVFTGAVLLAALAILFYQAATETINNRDMWFSSTLNRVVGTVVANTIEDEQTNLNIGDYVVVVRADGQAADDFLVADTSNAVTAVPALSAAEQETFFQQVKTHAEDNGTTNWITEENFAVGYGFSGTAVAGEPSAALQMPEDTIESHYADGAAVITRDSVTISIAPVYGTEGIFSTNFEGTGYRATYYSWQMHESADADSVLYEVAVMESLDSQTQQLIQTGLFYLLILIAGVALLFLANWFLAKLILRPTEDGLRRQTEFVAAASHELRSPLAVIRASLSAEDAAENAGQAEKFRTAAADEAERMSHLVDDLLLLAGGDAGSWQLHKAPIDLDTLLIELAEGYTPLAKDQGVKLQLQLPEKTLPQLQGDAQRLRQILAAILDNALQYAPADTAITLSATAKRGKVSIKVADRGRGIPDAEKAKVFERFYQADQSRHDKAHFGLGLSVAKELAELHGGQLTASDTEDGGATFTLVLPVL